MTTPTSWVTVSAEVVIALHDDLLSAAELPGLARDKSLEGALARVEHRIAYGLIEDVFSLAAAYAAAISQGHCFNDGNKRTAFQVMDVVLVAHGVAIDWVVEEAGDQMVSLAQSQIDQEAFADWLRRKAKS
jgi:death-on-curing protein